jgi:hypothetical protein
MHTHEEASRRRTAYSPRRRIHTYIYTYIHWDLFNAVWNTFFLEHQPHLFAVGTPPGSITVQRDPRLRACFCFKKKTYDIYIYLVPSIYIYKYIYIYTCIYINRCIERVTMRGVKSVPVFVKK